MLAWGWGPGPAGRPAGGTVLQNGAGTEPQWLSGLNCGRRPGPRPGPDPAAAGWAAAPSACWPLSHRRHVHWKPGTKSTVRAQAGLFPVVHERYVHEQFLCTGDQVVPGVACQQLQSGWPGGGQVQH